MAKETTRRRGSSRSRAAAWTVVLLICLIWLSPPSMLMIAIAMPPTLVAWIIDRSHQKSATYCVAGMNFCGLFPFLMDLWTSTHSVKTATAIITDVFTLLVIYAAAAFGWLLFVAIPPVVGTFLTVMAQRRVSQLRNHQRQIIHEWGEGVTRAAGGTE